MDYLILSTEEIHGDFEVSLGRCRNQCYVHIYSRESRKHTHKVFTSMEKALEVYQTLVKWMALGLYSKGDRRKWLESQEG